MTDDQIFSQNSLTKLDLRARKLRADYLRSFFRSFRKA